MSKILLFESPSVPPFDRVPRYKAFPRCFQPPSRLRNPWRAKFQDTSRHLPVSDACAHSRSRRPRISKFESEFRADKLYSAEELYPRLKSVLGELNRGKDKRSAGRVSYRMRKQRGSSRCKIQRGRDGEGVTLSRAPDSPYGTITF